MITDASALSDQATSDARSFLEFTIKTVFLLLILLAVVIMSTSILVIRGLQRDGESLWFVRDNGIGIDPRYHQKVFDLFDKLNRKTEGPGIGLALVKRIVDTHGGRVWVESEGMGRGSTFYFTLSSKGEVPQHDSVRNAG